MNRFDDRARTWDDLPGRREWAEAMAAAIRKEVKLTRAMTALEYGSGTGLLSFTLQPHLGSITLADSSTGMLEVAREKITLSGVTNMTALKLDLSVDPLPPQRFDLIYTLMVLHHIPDTLGILRKFHALLTPHGILCIADLDKEDGTFHDDPTGVHHFGFERALVKGMLAHAGFTEFSDSTVAVIQKGLPDQIRNYPVFLITARKPE